MNQVKPDKVLTSKNSNEGWMSHSTVACQKELPWNLFMPMSKPISVVPLLPVNKSLKDPKPDILRGHPSAPNGHYLNRNGHPPLSNGRLPITNGHHFVSNVKSTLANGHFSGPKAHYIVYNEHGRVDDESGTDINQQCIRTYQESVSGMIGGTAYLNTVHMTAKLTSEGASLTRLASTSKQLIHASAAAAFFARAAQKLTLHSSSPYKRRKCGSRDGGGEDGKPVAFTTDFAGILQNAPPPLPPSLLRTLGRKENCGIGKIKVLLKVASTGPEFEGASSFFNVDKRKRQVTLFDPTACGELCSTPDDRRLGITAPKIFAFDAVFSRDDSLSEICGSALIDILDAVVNGSDGCIMSFGHLGLGKSETMVGDSCSPNGLGVIPCAISWLFKVIGDQKLKSGSRFSVRISAVELFGPGENLKDLLAPYASDLEQSPGVYLRDDPLFGAQLQNYSELRAPTPEKAGFYLDAAVAGREKGSNNHMLYTIHLYQYSIDKTGKGGVAGGRSRLHLFDLGSGDKSGKGGLSLSAIGNVLIAIFNGQKHLPHRDSKLTLLLREALGSITCQAALLTHVSSLASNYSEILTTVQLAARMHRMRRRKPKMVISSEDSRLGKTLLRSSEDSSKSSSDVDPSSSEQSCDTVIYVGPADDATDGEHPPVYIPNLEEGETLKPTFDSTMGTDKKSFKHGAINRPRQTVSSPLRTPIQSPAKVKSVANKTSGCGQVSSPSHGYKSPKSQFGSPAKVSKPIESSPSHNRSPQTKRAGSRQTKDCEPLYSVPNKVKPSDEEWIDGPRFSKSKVVEGRKLKETKKEMWVDGPSACAKPPTGPNAQGYGYMDEHKKSMIEKWVETQTQQVKPSQEIWIDGGPSNKSSGDTCPKCQSTQKKEDNSTELITETSESKETQEIAGPQDGNEELLEDEVEEGEESGEAENSLEESPSLTPSDEFGDDVLDEEAGACYIETIEVPERDEPVPMTDSGAQVTEEDIAFCLGKLENPLPEVDQDPLEHPLRILSEENLTVASTFTDVYSYNGGQSHSLDDLPDYTQLSDDLSFAWKEEYFAKRFQSFDSTPKVPQRCQSVSIDEMLYGSDEQLRSLDHTRSLEQMRSFDRIRTFDDKITVESIKLPNAMGLNESRGVYDKSSNYMRSSDCDQARPVDTNRPGDYQSISSAPSEPSYQRSDLCSACQTSLVNKYDCDTNHCSNGARNLSSLRHPDGASNPNLAKHPSMTHVYEDMTSLNEQRIPGNGADEAQLKREERAIVGQVEEETRMTSQKVRANSKLSKILGTPSTKEVSPKKSSSKGRHESLPVVLEPNVYVIPGHHYERVDKPKDSGKPSKESPSTPRKSGKKHSKSKKNEEPQPIVYQPPWQKHQCPSSNRSDPQCHPTSSLDSHNVPEGYDSGNDSGVVARTPKGMRNGSLVSKQLKGVGVTHSPSLQCESSGYESVGLVRDSECSSLASSQDSENGDEGEKTLMPNPSPVRGPHNKGKPTEPLESKLSPIPEGKGSPKKSRENLNKVTLFTTCWSGKR